MTAEEKQSYMKLYRAANAEKINARKAEWRKENKSKVAAHKAAHYKKYRKEIIAKTSAYCKANAEKTAAAKSKWYQDNKERLRVAQLAYYKLHKDTIQARSTAWRIANPEKMAAYMAAYNTTNREKLNARQRARAEVRAKADPNFKLRRLLGHRAREALRRQNVKKSFQSHNRLLGCTVAEARAHIESQFEPWMTWENHGLYTWHIDHIQPLANFDLSDPAQVKQAFHYTNLRPLHWRKNIRKGARLIKN